MGVVMFNMHKYCTQYHHHFINNCRDDESLMTPTK